MKRQKTYTSIGYSLEPISWLDLPVCDDNMTYRPFFPRAVAKEVERTIGSKAVGKFFDYFDKLPIEEQKAVAEGTLESFVKKHGEQWK
jgi:hypothetical protein